MFSIKRWSVVLVIGCTCGPIPAQAVDSASDLGAQKATARLAQPVTWGSQDQPWAARRPVTATDRVAIQRYRSQEKAPIYSTTFPDSIALGADWTVERDDNPTLASCRRPDSVEASNSGLKLKVLLSSDCRSARWSTGHIATKVKYGYGFYEVTMKIADIPGQNNAFWLTTDDNFEIDVGEAQYPNYIHIGLQYWPPGKTEKHAGVGWGAKFDKDLSQGFHDLGLLWTPEDIVFEVDGEPVAAALIHGAIKGPANVRLSTALGNWAGKVPEHPEGHSMIVQSFRVFSLENGPAKIQDLPSHGVTRKLSEIGIDRSGLSMQSEAVRQKTLESIHALHATWFRDGPSSGSPRGIANFVEEVRLAKQQGLNVLMNIVQMDEDYDVPLFTHDHGWKAKKLSQINLNKFGQRFSNLLSALKAANLTIDAVEFGNEDDSYYYDADVPNGHAASPEELHSWLRGYGEFLKTGAGILHDSRFYPQAKIITFGIAHGCDHCGGLPQHLSSPAHVVALLKDVDGFNYIDNAGYHVDGYGTHIYASPSACGSSATALLRQDIWALGRDKPLWITEWGFTDATKFPNKQGQTVSEGLIEILNAFDDLSQRIPIGPMFFYSYDSGLADAKGKASGVVDASGNFVPAASVLSNRADQAMR